MEIRMPSGAVLVSNDESLNKQRLANGGVEVKKASAKTDGENATTKDSKKGSKKGANATTESVEPVTTNE